MSGNPFDPEKLAQWAMMFAGSGAPRLYDASGAVVYDHAVTFESLPCAEFSSTAVDHKDLATLSAKEWQAEIERLFAEWAKNVPPRPRSPTEQALHDAGISVRIIHAGDPDYSDEFDGYIALFHEGQSIGPFPRSALDQLAQGLVGDGDPFDWIPKEQKAIERRPDYQRHNSQYGSKDPRSDKSARRPHYARGGKRSRRKP